ncbi:MAG: AzlC family ABC transporter permease [Aerococcus sp.]|nr:AzlC family ABC transporter permease [Aerococcus sp.]
MKNEMINGFKAAIPIMLSYIFLGVAAGVVFRNFGMEWWQVLFFGLLVFGGASEFTGAAMLATGAGVPEIMITMLLLNMRQILYSVTYSAYTEGQSTWKSLVLAGISSDEAFAMNTAKWEEAKHDPTKSWSLNEAVWTALFPYLTWAFASVAGALLGQLITLPDLLTGFLTTSMFIGLLIPALTSRLTITVALFSAALALILQLFISNSIVVILVTLIGCYFGYRLQLRQQRYLKTFDHPFMKKEDDNG